MAGERILVVDDNPTNMKLVSYVLTSRGYEVQTASDAQQAFAVLETFTPRLILMDLQLPGMDGFELTRLLKTEFRTRDVVIVAVTAYGIKGYEDEARAAGCDGYIAKPIDTRTLPVRVAEYLARGLGRAGGAP